MKQDTPAKQVPRSMRSLSRTRRILPPAQKPTHFTMAEIRRLVQQVNKVLRESGES